MASGKSGKSRNGRGGGSSRSRRDVTANHVSSISSTAAGTSNNSPPSVSRRSLPDPKASQNHMHPPQQTRFSPPSHTSFQQPQPSRSHQNSQREGSETGNLHQPQASAQRSLPMGPLDQLQQRGDPAQSDGDTSEESEDSSDDEQHHAEGQMTLDQLLNIEGRDNFVERLSPTPGKGLWCV